MVVYYCACVCVCVFRRGREELAHRRVEERSRHEAEEKRRREEEEERRKAEEEKAQRQKEEEKRLQQQVTDVFISFSITRDLVLHSDWRADLDSFSVTAVLMAVQLPIEMNALFLIHCCF